MTWNFGDGTYSTGYYPSGLNPIHYYNDFGIFNVTLTAIDYSTTPPRYAFDDSFVAFVWDGHLNITVPCISVVTIKANILNYGEYEATNVNWKINISWGLLQRERNIANGTIVRIKNGESVTVQNERYFFGFGRIQVIISVIPENIGGMINVFKGFKLGPLIFLSISR